MNEKTCKARIGKELKSEIETLRALWELYKLWTSRPNCNLSSPRSRPGGKS